MFRLEGGRPGDQRGFLHKSFIGRAVGSVAKRVIKSTPIGSALSTGLGIARGFGRRPARPVASRTTTARPSLAGAQGKELGRDLKFGFDTTLPTTGFPPTTSLTLPFVPPGAGGGGGCPSGLVLCKGNCVSPESVFGRRCLASIGGAGIPIAGTGVGEAVMGQFGAALEPGMMTIERSVCLPGMQLAKDGLCYNKGAITNSQRMWPRGRRPLLTGGDMRAIGIAARAGSKLDRTTKRLRALGMMKALPKGRGTHAHAKPIAAVSVN